MAWSSSDGFTPSQVLKLAKSKTIECKFDEALEKFLWYHENALSLDQSQKAVRTSFALGAWMELALKYRPALVAFNRVRDETESRCRKNPNDFQLFMDVASLNRYLNTNDRTARLFIEIANTSLTAAAQIYHVAERTLIDEGLFRECLPFIEFERRADTIIHVFQVVLALAADESDIEDSAFLVTTARQIFIDKASTLIALLVRCGRNDTAQNTYDRFISMVDDFDSRSLLDLALSGNFPRS